MDNISIQLCMCGGTTTDLVVDVSYVQSIVIRVSWIKNYKYQ